MTPDARALLLAHRDELEFQMGQIQTELDQINQKLGIPPDENPGVIESLRIVAETLHQAANYLANLASEL